MEHIKQLKTIRDETLNRLHTNPDYKLLTSLDSLIVELEGVTALAELAEKSVSNTTTIKPVNTKDKAETLDDAFDKLNTAKKANGTGGSIVDLSDEINGGVSLS